MNADNALEVFRFEGDKPIRTIKDENGEPWFAAADVCKALSVVNVGDALTRLDEDERRNIAITDVAGRTAGRSTDVAFCNEAGVYRLIFTSRKTEAEKFKRWLAHDVLPSIRKTGKYELPRGYEQYSHPSKPTGSALNTDPRMLAAQLRGIADSVEQLMASVVPVTVDNERVALLEADNHEMMERMARLEAKVDAINIGESYFTIVAWYKYKGFGDISQENASMVGKQAAKLSRERNVPTGKARHPVWGEVNTYHESILEAITGN